MSERGNRRREVGVVAKDKGDKTITVEVRKLTKHAKYGKYVFVTTKCYVHDEQNEAKVGDKVEIMECRPISRTKRWRLIQVLTRALV